MAGFTTSTHKMHNSNKTTLNIGGKLLLCWWNMESIEIKQMYQINFIDIDY